MTFSEPPAAAAWQHRDSRQGFETVWFHRTANGYRIEGCTTALEDGEIWMVEYTIEVDSAWLTREALITGRTSGGSRRLHLAGDGTGHWLADGTPAPQLDGCLDVDLESSAMTNTLPVHRLALPMGGRANAPAAYVRAMDLSTDRLDQTYRRSDDRQYDYASPAFDYADFLEYDQSGLILEYPGIAVRVG